MQNLHRYLSTWSYDRSVQKKRRIDKFFLYMGTNRNDGKNCVEKTLIFFREKNNLFRFCTDMYTMFGGTLWLCNVASPDVLCVYYPRICVGQWCYN